VDDCAAPWLLPEQQLISKVIKKQQVTVFARVSSTCFPDLCCMAQSLQSTLNAS
jgi:hypothetical protein